MAYKETVTRGEKKVGNGRRIGNQNSLALRTQLHVHSEGYHILIMLACGLEEASQMQKNTGIIHGCHSLVSSLES